MAVLSEGACSNARPQAVACTCPMGMAAVPVCGRDGQTHNSSCAAGCKGVAVAYNGQCRSGLGAAALAMCSCPPHYMPVCGAGGVTYASSCVAQCLRQSVIAGGECRSGEAGRQVAGQGVCRGCMPAASVLAGWCAML
jgi:hypothetical protein